MTAGRGKDFCPKRWLVPPWWTSGQWDNTRCGLTFSTTTTTTSEITSETIALQRKKERNNEITKKMSKTFVASTNLSEFYFSFSFFLSLFFLRLESVRYSDGSSCWAESRFNQQRPSSVDGWGVAPSPFTFVLSSLFSLARAKKKERKKKTYW